MQSALVYSGRSRKNRRDPGLAARVHAELPAQAARYVASSIDDMRRALSACRADAVDTLFLLGGDGTHRVALEQAIEIYGEDELPKIVFLRGGTMNTVSNALGIPRRSPQYLAARAVRGKAREVRQRLLRVESDVGTHHGFLFGTGVMNRFLAEYERRADPTALDGARTLARAVLEAAGLAPASMLARERVKLTVDRQKTSEREVLTVAAGTVEQIGLGFKLFARAKESDTAFHVISLHGPSARIPMSLPRIHRGRGFSENVADELLCTTMLIEGVDGPINYMIDGDLLPPTRKIELSMGPAIRLLV